MNGWDDPKVIVAIYAAIISTISLLWNIINLILKHTKKLKVESIFNQTFMKNSLTGDLSDVFPILTIKITNQKNNDLMINNPSLCFNKKIQFPGIKSNKFQSFNDGTPEKYPKEIKVGDIYKKDLNMNSLYNNFQDKYNENDKFWIEVTDTFDKIYKSKKYKFKKIIEQINVANQVNKKRNPV